MLFGKPKPKIDRQAQLAAKPLRLVNPATERADDGGASLTIQLKASGAGNWFFRVPEGATKTFELDQMGMQVWDNIDGKTTVRQLIRKLGKRYHLSLREAEVSTLAFLNMLTRKNLIAMQVASGSAAQKSESDAAD